MSTFLERTNADVSNIFLGGDGFDMPASFTFSGDAGAEEIRVIFHENYEPTDQFSGEIVGAGPAAFCALADVVDDDGELPQSDATIVINNVTYYVLKAMSEGDVVILQLSKDAPGGQDVDE